MEWDIPEGFTCRVERSFDLLTRTPVGEEVTPESAPAWLDDDGVGDEPQCFWRINAEGLDPSDPVAMFRITRLRRLDEG